MEASLLEMLDCGIFKSTTKRVAQLFIGVPVHTHAHTQAHTRCNSVHKRPNRRTAARAHLHVCKKNK